jgi:hypothetical protein
MTACLLWLGISLVSCRKDAVCKAVITARYLRNGNSNEVVPGCNITVGEPEFADSVRFVGVTDANGRLEHSWRNEAKLKVIAEIDGHRGNAMLHLVKGETVELDVQIPVD